MISVFPFQEKPSLDGQAILLGEHGTAGANFAALQRHALVVTAALWSLVMLLLFVADWVAPGALRASVVVSNLTSLPLVLVAGWLTYWMVERLHKKRGLRFVAYLALVVGTAFVQTAKDMYILGMLEDGSIPSFFSLALRAAALHLLMLGVLASIFMTWIQARQQLEQQHALARAREAESEARLLASRAESAAVEARLSALRYQLNPHFLFNTLNAISSMVVTGRNEAAEGMLDRLCEFLRATLATKTSGLVPLEDELATMASYLEIENFRLRDRLHVEFVCPPELVTALVPGFVLQPLIENAIKHGVGRSSRQVTLTVAVSAVGVDQLRIRVSDDAIPDIAAAPSKGFGVGLGNVAARLEAIYGQAARLTAASGERGYVAQLDLPLQLAGAAV